MTTIRNTHNYFIENANTISPLVDKETAFTLHTNFMYKLSWLFGSIIGKGAIRCKNSQDGTVGYISRSAFKYWKRQMCAKPTDYTLDPTQFIEKVMSRNEKNKRRNDLTRTYHKKVDALITEIETDLSLDKLEDLQKLFRATPITLNNEQKRRIKDIQLKIESNKSEPECAQIIDSIRERAEKEISLITIFEEPGIRRVLGGFLQRELQTTLPLTNRKIRDNIEQILKEIDFTESKPEEMVSYSEFMNKHIHTLRVRFKN